MGHNVRLERATAFKGFVAVTSQCVFASDPVSVGSAKAACFGVTTSTLMMVIKRTPKNGVAFHIISMQKKNHHLNPLHHGKMHRPGIEPGASRN